MVNSILKQVLLISVMLFSTIILYSQDISKIKFKSWHILDDYAKELVCNPINLKSSISIDKTYKIYIQNISVNDNVFTVKANLSVKCFCKKNGKYLKPGEEVRSDEIIHSNKKIPMIIIGQMVGNQITISKLKLNLFNNSSNFHQVFPSNFGF